MEDMTRSGIRDIRNNLARLFSIGLLMVRRWIEQKVENEPSFYKRVLIQAAMTSGGTLTVSHDIGPAAKNPQLDVLCGSGVVEVVVFDNCGRMSKWKPDNHASAACSS